MLYPHLYLNCTVQEKMWPEARLAAGFTCLCMDYKNSVIDISRIPELLQGPYYGIAHHPGSRL